MNLSAITPGLTATAHKAVADADLATAHRSGTVDVFATPAMIALMEEAAVAALADALPADLTSVGIHLEVQHLAATPRGMPVRATATVTGIDGRIVAFELTAADAVEQIGRGTHRRAVVERAKFQRRADEKSAS